MGRETIWGHIRGTSWIQCGPPAIDTLMVTLTPAQACLVEPSKQADNSKGPHLFRPSVLPNDIEGAFNCIGHERPLQIRRHCQLPRKLVGTIASFNINREMRLSFEGETEAWTPGACRLRQGFPSSPVLFILSSSVPSRPKRHL